MADGQETNGLQTGERGGGAGGRRVPGPWRGRQGGGGRGPCRAPGGCPLTGCLFLQVLLRFYPRRPEFASPRPFFPELLPPTLSAASPGCGPRGPSSASGFSEKPPTPAAPPPEVPGREARPGLARRPLARRTHCLGDALKAPISQRGTLRPGSSDGDPNPQWRAARWGAALQSHGGLGPEGKGPWHGARRLASLGLSFRLWQMGPGAFTCARPTSSAST